MVSEREALLIKEDIRETPREFNIEDSLTALEEQVRYLKGIQASNPNPPGFLCF